jgi:hypothetical protein
MDIATTSFILAQWADSLRKKKTKKSSKYLQLKKCSNTSTKVPSQIQDLVPLPPFHRITAGINLEYNKPDPNLVLTFSTPKP